MRVCISGETTDKRTKTHHYYCFTHLQHAKDQDRAILGHFPAALKRGNCRVSLVWVCPYPSSTVFY